MTGTSLLRCKILLGAKGAGVCAALLIIIAASARERLAQKEKERGKNKRDSVNATRHKT